MTILVESKQLTKSYVLGKQNEHSVLKDVNLQITKGEFVSVMGPSGSGKSTLLYNISGMDRMTSGSVVFNGHELASLSEQALSTAILILTFLRPEMMNFNEKLASQGGNNAS